MKQIKQCGVCEGYYESYNDTRSDLKPNAIKLVRITDTDDEFTKKTIECCPECMTAIKNTMASRLKVRR